MLAHTSRHFGEDTPNHAHFGFVYLVADALTSFVLDVPEAVGWFRTTDDHALTGFLTLVAPGSLCSLFGFSFRLPTLDKFKELALMGVVAPIIQGNQPRTALGEFLIQPTPVVRVARDTVGILAEYHRDATRFYQVPNPLQPWTLQHPAGVSWIGDLLYYLVTHFGGVFPQGFDLLIH